MQTLNKLYNYFDLALFLITEEIMKIFFLNYTIKYK